MEAGEGVSPFPRDAARSVREVEILDARASITRRGSGYPGGSIVPESRSGT